MKERELIILFKISDGDRNAFAKLFENHRLCVSSSNIFYHTIRMINGKSKMIDRDTYKEYFLNLLTDIKLETPPIDAFIPNEDENVDAVFVVNDCVPEYERIKNRMTLDFFNSALPDTNEIRLQVNEKPELMTTILDDLFINFCLFKYLDQIDTIRIQELSNYTPVIEYVVNNITEKDIKNYMNTRRINEGKYRKYCDDIFFMPEFSVTCKFFNSDDDMTKSRRGDFPCFDVLTLIKKLTTNIVCQSDIYIITAIYLTMSFAIVDISNDNVDGSPCAKYVRDVLSKI